MTGSPVPAFLFSTRYMHRLSRIEDLRNRTPVVGELDLAVRQPALFFERLPSIWDICPRYFSSLHAGFGTHVTWMCPSMKRRRKPCLLARRCHRKRYAGIGPEDAAGDPLTPANRGAMNATISLCGM